MPAIIHAYARTNPQARFVQIGAHDGTQLDPLRDAILTTEWRGVMVEPLPFVFERLAERYARHPRISLENVAIGESDGSLPFHYIPEAEGLWRWYDALGSFRREVVLSHESFIPDVADRIRTVPVDCVTFDTLCARHDIDTIDLVQIDTEGYDARVLASIDLGRYRPSIVMFEHLHLPPDEKDAATARLVDSGYSLVEDAMDVIAIDDRARSTPAVATAFERATRAQDALR